ncbi:hypothetical protein BU17DRAFT_59408 [Hysterangium stoloniferum]|nr:hypothetical protein BU17DRAFT_59408 [Hysterangium stoloniferum]
MSQWIEFLSGVTPQYFDMCQNSCCLYAGDHIDQNTCEFCNAPRFHPNGKPVSHFSYMPLIPHLCGWFESPEMIKCMNYWNNCDHINGEINDIFDSTHYQELCERQVCIDGQELDHKYFSDHRDIALGGSTDGFQVRPGYIYNVI